MAAKHIQEKHADIETFFPLIALGVLLLLCICITRQYQLYGAVEPVVILPGGITYTGQ